MDSFDAIRKSAAALHDLVVKEGADPLDGAALVAAAAKELDLTLAWLDPDDPSLKGAHALFDEQSGTICCDKTAAVTERTILVAHEIGHAHVHTGSASCSADDIDPSRSSESVSVGLQRVEDYGAKERRELQANIFAREFLLPRTLAHRLHVDKLMGASAISEKMRLPKNLVRQQLLDALLLPVIPEEPSEDASSHASRPDPSQDEAALHRGSPFQLQAGPGTGKTRTLVKRVLSLLKDGIDPASILILTFSNRAAGELVERLNVATPGQASRMWIGTFHAFGLDLIRRYHDRLSLSHDPKLFDRSDVIEVLEEMLPTLTLVHYRNLWDPAMELCHVVAAISRAKDELVTPARYRELAEDMDRKAKDEPSNEKAKEAAEKCLEIALLYELYEKVLKDQGAVDFGDLIMRPAMLLASDEELRTALQLRHRHVLVDEYQDMNRASGMLLKSVAGDGKNLWVVGDARQSIYRFRGASSENMTAFSTDYQAVTVKQLSVNYRSTTEIVDTFVAIAPKMGASDGMLKLALTADRGAGNARPEIRRYETLDDEIGGIGATIRELETSGTKLRDQAVLCRGNRRLNEIAEGLEARGIPVLHLGSLFERSEVRDLLALLSLVIDPYADALVRVGSMPRYGLSLQDIRTVTGHLRVAGIDAPNGLIGAASIAGLPDSAVKALTMLAKDFKGTEIQVSAWEFLTTYLLDRTDLGSICAAGTTVAERMRSIAIWQLMNFVRESSPTGSGLQIRRTLDRVRQLVLLSEERDLRQVPAPALAMNAVRLMTVHGSKGLEFEGVHIPGLTVKSFPLSSPPPRCPPPVGLIESFDSLSVSDAGKRAQKIEEECLLFVAVSRARTRLTLSLARKQRNGDNRSASSFLDWLPSNLVAEIPKPAVLPRPPASVTSFNIGLKLPAGWSLTDRRLASYQKCPRRFFYTHVLELGGARKPTAFTRTQDCIYDLIRWLSAARREDTPTLESAEKAFEEIWGKRGPVKHGFARDYRRLASRLIASLISSGAGRKFREAAPIAFDLRNGRVVVEPNELAELPDGTVILRRVQTGYKRSKEEGILDYALYTIAGQEHFGDSVIVEAVYLTDGNFEPVTITDRVLSNRREEADQMLADIAVGEFPLEVDSVTCPRCPHFFYCPATPHGSLDLQQK